MLLFSLTYLFEGIQSANDTIVMNVNIFFRYGGKLLRNDSVILKLDYLHSGS